LKNIRISDLIEADVARRKHHEVPQLVTIH
jgi:hypothetical protein